MNKTSFQCTYSPHTVIISGKHASPCTWSDRGTPAYQEVFSECIGTSWAREEELEALSSMGTTSLYVIHICQYLPLNQSFELTAHLGVLKRTTGAPVTAFARARQY
jgi:hypothetical protein